MKNRRNKDNIMQLFSITREVKKAYPVNPVSIYLLKLIKILQVNKNKQDHPRTKVETSTLPKHLK